VPASLVFASALIVLSYVVSSNITALAPSVATRLVPIGIATVLVGYFMLVTRRRAVSQIVGLLLVDNGIALVTFLLTAGVPLVVELGAALDVLLVVVVLVVNIRNQRGSSELDQLKELHD
jgi:hydrogenase-4 component E